MQSTISTFVSTALPPAKWTAILLATSAMALTACGGAGTPSFKPIEINIAHIDDHHSQLDAVPVSASSATNVYTLDGVATQVELGGFARQTAMFKAVASTPNLLKLHAGDALTGSLYYTFFKGVADAQMMNTICFDAFIPGNHEFDDGDGIFKGFLDELGKGTCKTPTLSANIVPQVGTPLAPTAGASYFKPYIIKQIEGVSVGIVGITAATKTMNSSRPLSTTQFLNEVTSAQKAIDELKTQGIRHIVLMTHIGYDNDKAIASQLTDVDVIIGGDSHTQLGDFSALGFTSSGAYPTLAKNKDGDTVCIGHAWEYAKEFGLMNVKFNDRGSVSQCGGQASLLIGNSFMRKDTAGVWKAMTTADSDALVAKLANQPAVKVVTPDAAAAQILSTFSSQVIAAKATTIGTATEDLCLVRMPGETTNRSTGIASCATANTLARGSDAAQVVGEAFLRASKRADFALQNAGGVRVPVTAGTLSMNTAFTLLPFTNVLVELDIKGSEMISALEDGVANHLDNAQSSGSHPYAAGLRWDLDMSRAKGQRFSNVQVRDKVTGAWSVIDPTKTYVLVTNDFVAAGSDGYATLGVIYKAGRYVNTYLLYTQSFVDYVIAQKTIGQPAAADYSHQKVTSKAGAALP
jgi:5'-nucleotidase